MKKIFSLVAASLVSVAMMAELAELKLYTTNFQDWDAVSSSTTASSKTVTTRFSNEELTISFCETQIDPNGTNAKFTKDFITTGYAMAAKTATPYIETSALASITKVHYVHAATGGSRGWGLQVKGDGDADWVTVYSTVCEQSGSEVDVTINRTNVQLRWYNLNGSQNAYMTEFAIYGMAEDDGSAAEFTISYFDQEGVRLGDTIQTEDETLDFAFSEADLSIPEGYKFRGWYDAGMTRHNEGEAINGDLRLTALVTEIEKAEIGKFYEYDLTKNTFYDDDHECFLPTGGAYHGSHGWTFTNGGKLELPVGGNAYVKVGLCSYADSLDITVTTKSGSAVTSFIAKSAKDGEVKVFFYNGAADTLVLSFAGRVYLHNVAIFNVKGEVVKDSETGYYILSSGDAAALLMTLKQVVPGDKIFLPNGIYDLGETVLTEINKNNISIIGESMDGTIIKNAPDAKNESIDKTATLKITDDISGTYLQDLTIQNALDYYKANNGRAVCLWDRGTQTICKNVRLLSYQDTYYSNKSGKVKYFEDCEIHGTVDFICGDGSVYFKNNLLYAEKRASTGGGSDALTANNGPATDKGYVFEGCTIKSECPTVSFGRAWNNTPSVAFLNTLVDYSAGEFSFTGSGISRWTEDLMNGGAWPKFGEYNTHLADGTSLTPATNVVTFKDKSPSTETRNIETVLSAEDAAVYTMEYTLGAWAATAAKDAKQVAVEADGQYEADGIYLIETESECRIMLGSEIAELPVNSTIRKANARGGFGWKAGEEPQGVENASNFKEGNKVQKIMRNGQLIILRDNNEYNVLGGLVK